MADNPQDLFFFNQANQILGLTVITRESHQLRVSVSQNPVMGGAPITDHAFMLPRQVRLSVFVSDNPIWTSTLFSASLDGLFFDMSQGGISNTLGSITGSLTRAAGLGDLADSPTRSKSAFAKIMQLCAVPQLLKVQTQLYLYENMVATGFTPTQTVENVNALEGELELSEFWLADSAFRQFLHTDNSFSNQTTSQNNKGDLQGQSPPPDFQKRLS